MNFGNIKTRVAQETGMDLTLDDSIVESWVNGAYQDISSKYNWPWLYGNYTLQTVADITTGTVTISAGGTNGAFSSAPSISVASAYMIQFTEQSEDWYFISSHTAASTSFDISVPFVGSSNYTAGPYIVRKVFYSLASDLDRILDLRQVVTQSKLECIDPQTFDRLVPNPTQTGTPIYYYLTGIDSSNDWQIGFFPIPNAVINIQVRYFKKITELSDDNDEPMIPEKFRNAIVWGALFLYGHPFIDDARVKLAAERYGEAMSQMMKNYSPIPDKATVIQPWDTRVRLGILPLQYPFDSPNWGRY